MDPRIQNHPQYTRADYTYLRGKGYSVEQILAFWDRDAALGQAPVKVNKYDHPVRRVLDLQQARTLAAGALSITVDPEDATLWRIEGRGHLRRTGPLTTSELRTLLADWPN